MLSLYKERIPVRTGYNIRGNSKNHPWYESGVRIDSLDNTLPIVFIPSFTVKKLKALGLDYKKELNKLGMRRFNLEESNNHKTNIKAFNNLVGIDESILIQALNIRMVRGLTNRNYKTYPTQDYLTFMLSESDYNTVVVNKLTPTLSVGCGDRDYYTIEKDKNCIYIIMNTNSFYNFSDMYKKLSKELCEMLLGLVDDSFVFQSVYFNTL